MTRNRIAGIVAILSGVLFLMSGYRASIANYELIERQLDSIKTIGALSELLKIPLDTLAFLSQLSGITVIAGAGFFISNRVNLGKFLIMVGTGQGMFTIILRIISDAAGGNVLAASNFVLWLTSTAAGLGVVFAVLAQSLSKGKGESIYSRLLRVVFRIKKNE